MSMTIEHICTAVSLKAINSAEAETLLKARTAKARKSNSLSLSTSDKGCLCISGLRSFPVTLYADEILEILEIQDAIKAFLKDNADLLPTKAQKLAKLESRVMAAVSAALSTPAK